MAQAIQLDLLPMEGIIGPLYKTGGRNPKRALTCTGGKLAR